MKQVAEDFDAVVHDDVDVLISVEAVGFLEEIGAVAEEKGRVVAYPDVPDKPLHVAHALRISHQVVILDMHFGFLALNGIILLSHKDLCQQKEQDCYIKPFVLHRFQNNAQKQVYCSRLAQK